MSNEDIRIRLDYEIHEFAKLQEKLGALIHNDQRMLNILLRIRDGERK